jgi:hypothetical protein
MFFFLAFQGAVRRRRDLGWWRRRPKQGAPVGTWQRRTDELQGSDDVTDGHRDDLPTARDYGNMASPASSRWRDISVSSMCGLRRQMLLPTGLANHDTKLAPLPPPRPNSAHPLPVGLILIFFNM